MLFCAAVAAGRVAPRAAPALLLALLVAAVVPVAFALASRVWPGALAENEVSNRLGQPFDYWNAVGCVAAMAVPVALWLGARRTGSPTARMLAYPAMGACVLAILFSRSRAAPRPPRSPGRSSGSCSCPCACAACPCCCSQRRSPPAWRRGRSRRTPSRRASSRCRRSRTWRTSSARSVLMLGLLLLLGAAVEAAAARRVPSARARRHLEQVAIAAACLVPLAAFTSVAFSDRGIGDRFDELTSETQVAPRRRRAFAASSSRGKYWREAFHVFADRPFEGVGAGGYAYGRLRYRTDLGHAPRPRLDPSDRGGPGYSACSSRPPSAWPGCSRP